jgi:hypothetical protein
MNAPDRQAEIASLVPVSWWPGKQRLAALVRRSRLTLANTEGELTIGLTQYQDWSLHEPRWVKEGCGQYVFADMQGGVGQDVTAFLFNAPPPAPEGGGFAQQLIEEVNTSEDYAWPPILTDLQMILASGAYQTGPGLNLTAAVDRGVWRNGQTVPCLVQTRTYVSLTQPPSKLCKTNVPMPTEIRGDYFGQPIRIPACLHPTVILESQSSDNAVIYDAVPSRAALRTGNKLVYRATNQLSWSNHIFVNRVTKEEGYYRRVERTVTAPSLPPLTYV